MILLKRMYVTLLVHFLIVSYVVYQPSGEASKSVPQLRVKEYHSSFSIKRDLAFQNPRKLMCLYRKKPIQSNKNDFKIVFSLTTKTVENN